MTHKAYEEKQINVQLYFLDAANAFDRRHEGLVNKLGKMLPKQYNFLKSCITGQVFQDKEEEAFFTIKYINAGVPQKSVLGPIV